ncbi:hypothetical protein DL89DRAFT_264969 [Linderina pennispora]|uniref:Uncharacterized protein n=1 Tax=Linderina pennispora TaxID=61395 RepID=A0A1Y1WGY2_9FUNG|nr:uncharacterized protein DL89DRAFT_264969 [Linderina pennispora]ORX72769.1 hypothetical protein DL89DRAFT_264969 [Linderina pennispora]
MAALIEEANRADTPPAGLTSEELEKFYEPVRDANDPLKPFPNNTNPVTGESRRRFGDWERNGRVSDF